MMSIQRSVRARTNSVPCAGCHSVLSGSIAAPPDFYTQQTLHLGGEVSQYARQPPGIASLQELCSGLPVLGQVVLPSSRKCSG